MLPLCCLQLLPKTYVHRFGFDEVHVSLVCTHSMGLSNSDSCAGPLDVPQLLCNTWLEGGVGEGKRGEEEVG
eukprot:1159729-Pelagomonas_calceolata.AAC.3